MKHSCPLCAASETSLQLQHSQREFWHCPVCDLIFVPEKFQLSHAQELAIYEKHENDPQDAGYRKHLGKLVSPLLQKIETTYGPNARCLDFGSGPGPTLSLMLKEVGLNSLDYDPYFAKSQELLAQKYQVITMTEVIEHFNTPKQTIESVLAMLEPGGTLAIMTQLHDNEIPFEKWHYKNDPTHIALFSKKTMEYLSETYRLNLEFIRADVFFFTKS